MADIDQSLAAGVPADELSILRHALGVGEDGCSPSYRNHFVTGEGGADHRLCMALVTRGFMVRRAGNAITGGSDLFNVTLAGRAAAVAPPPKLTRGQRRYAAFLRADDGSTFGEWLRMHARRRSLGLPTYD